MGPRQVWVPCRVGVDDSLDGHEVESLVRGLDRALRVRSAYVCRVDVVPTGTTQGLLDPAPFTG